MDRFPDGAAETRAASCPEHGEYQSTKIPFSRNTWTRCTACMDEATKQRQADEMRQAEETRRADREREIAASGIPTRFVGRTFDTFVATTDAQRHALSIARDYAEQFKTNRDAGKGLIFSGLPGTGKSHLATALMQSQIGRCGLTYVTCMDLIREVRATWRRESVQSEVEVLAEFGRVDLLVVDEIGVQYGTDGEQTILFDVLDRRYREVRPTVLLTNQDKAGFEQFIGERAFDRLKETCRWVPFDWPSYRPQARKEEHVFDRGPSLVKARGGAV